MSRIKLKFRGKTWVIPETKAFEAGERVEEIVTLGEMAGWGAAPKFHKLARAFAELLRFAGCKVTNTEVHSAMMAEVKAIAVTMKDGVVPDEARMLVAAQAIGALSAVLMDGAPEGDLGGEDAGNATAS